MPRHPATPAKRIFEADIHGPGHREWLRSLRHKTRDASESMINGNTKAAIKSAGGSSSDLWAVPPDQIHYDPSDNVRPLDPGRVRHIAELIKANGYDRKKPLGCFIRKVNSKDLIFVYEGQHRYHAALLAIKEGFQIERLPIVIDDAKSVNRINLIFSGIVNNEGEKLTPLELAAKVVELQALNVDNETIRTRLNITDQTIRDVLLLANAPAGLHELVRSKHISSTLAINEIRANGADEAFRRLQNAVDQAAEAGQSRITKKAITKPLAGKITVAAAKQLLQALQLVLSDPAVNRLSPQTLREVESAIASHARGAR